MTRTTPGRPSRLAGSGTDGKATSGRTLRDVFLPMLAVAAVAIAHATRLAPGRVVSRSEPAPKPEDDLALATMEP